MAVPALSAAKTLCEMQGWRLLNLELQKILYIAQMLHLGRTGRPLLREPFEAWDYGPVIPSLYHRAKAFGSGPVRNVFHWERSVPEGSEELASLRQALINTRGMNPGQLVAATHWNGGAWARHYRPGVRGVTIPNRDILTEYNARRHA